MIFLRQYRNAINRIADMNIRHHNFANNIAGASGVAFVNALVRVLVVVILVVKMP